MHSVACPKSETTVLDASGLYGLKAQHTSQAKGGLREKKFIKIAKNKSNALMQCGIANLYNYW